MTTVRGARPEDVTGDALRDAVEDVVDPYLDALADDPILLLPDAHYPYHPSTGLVTNPDVVRALVDVVIESADAASVRIGLPPSHRTDGRIGRGLWYESIAADRGIELVDLDESSVVERPVHLANESVSVEVPKPLVDDAVVAVPTVRRTADLGLESAMVCLGRALAESPGPRDVRLAVHACDPVVTVLDGTYVFAGEPRSARYLAAADDPIALSHVAADLLDLGPGDVPHLDSPEGAIREPTAVEGPRPGEIVDSLPNSEPSNTDTDDLMARGYRLYARVAGDLVPPQLLRSGADD